MKIEVKRTVTKALNTDRIITVLRHESDSEDATVRVDKESLKDAADVIETLVKEKEKEGTLCAKCANEECHCDCTREFIPKVQVEKSREAKAAMEEVQRLRKLLDLLSPSVGVIHISPGEDPEDRETRE